MLARSSPNRPGTTRRAGRTIQSVSAETNCPTGLRNGARNHCMWKRKSSAYTKKPNAVWISRWAIWLNIALPASFLAQLVAQFLAALVGGMDRAEDRLGLLAVLAGDRLREREQAGNPFADHRRRIGHRSNQARVSPQPLGEVGEAHARGDADDEIGVVRNPGFGGRFAQMLGFH